MYRPEFRIFETDASGRPNICLNRLGPVWGGACVAPYYNAWGSRVGHGHGGGLAIDLCGAVHRRRVTIVGHFLSKFNYDPISDAIIAGCYVVSISCCRCGRCVSIPISLTSCFDYRFSPPCITQRKPNSRTIRTRKIRLFLRVAPNFSRLCCFGSTGSLSKCRRWFSLSLIGTKCLWGVIFFACESRCSENKTWDRILCFSMRQESESNEGSTACAFLAVWCNLADNVSVLVPDCDVDRFSTRVDLFWKNNTFSEQENKAFEFL